MNRNLGARSGRREAGRPRLRAVQPWRGVFGAGYGSVGEKILNDNNVIAKTK